MKSFASTHPRLRISARLALAALSVALVAGCGGLEPQGPDQTGSVAQAQSVAAVQSLTLSSTTVAAGGSITGTVTLSGSAESSSGGVVVYIGFKSAFLAGPKFIRIPNGRSSGTFTLYTNPFLSAATGTSVSATTSSPQPFSYVAVPLSIVPSPTPPGSAAPQVSSVTLSPATVTSGSPVTGTVSLDAPAPQGGAVVQLANSNDFFNVHADLPPIVLVPGGATSATFTVRSHLSTSVAAYVQEIVVANYFGGPFQGASLTIAP